jgi:hypothetical protein
LLEAVAINFQDAFEEVPEQEQAAPIEVSVSAQNLEVGGDVEEADLQAVHRPALEGAARSLRSVGISV